MAETLVLPRTSSISFRTQFLRLIPGVALLAVIGYAGKLLEKNVNLYARSHHWVFPNMANLSRWAFLLTFAGVGLRADFKEMRKQGLRPFAVGFIGEVVIAVFTLGLVIGAGKLFGF